MTKIETVRGFSHLFHGRHDAWFESFPKGGKARWSPVTLELYRKHLTGAIEIGTYPVTDDGQCRWGCIDIDKDDFTLATDIWSVWNYYGIQSWIECSRSKGWHIWTFAKDWLPAKIMRQAGLHVLRIARTAEKECGLRELEAKTEVNPKNDAPWHTKTGLVNTVRLPYSGRAKPGRMTVVEPRTSSATPLGDFVREASASACSRSLLEAVSRLQTEHEARENRLRRLAHSNRQDGEMSNTGSSYQEAAQILRGERRITAGERDNQYWTLANYMKSLGYSPETAKQAIARLHATATDEPWTFPLEQALEKVDRSY